MSIACRQLKAHSTQLAHKITTSHRYDFSLRVSRCSLTCGEALSSSVTKEVSHASRRAFLKRGKWTFLRVEDKTELLDVLVCGLSFDPWRLGVVGFEALILRLEARCYLVKDLLDFCLLVGANGFVATAHPHDGAISVATDELIVEVACLLEGHLWILPDQASSELSELVLVIERTVLVATRRFDDRGVRDGEKEVALL